MQRCSATRRDGRPCRAWAIRGGRVCRMHGGGAPQVRAAAERRTVEAKAERYLARRLGGELHVHPLEAAEGLLARDVADVEALRELVAELPGTIDEEQVRAWAEGQVALSLGVML